MSPAFFERLIIHFLTALGYGGDGRIVLIDDAELARLTVQHQGNHIRESRKSTKLLH